MALIKIRGEKDALFVHDDKAHKISESVEVRSKDDWLQIDHSEGTWKGTYGKIEGIVFPKKQELKDSDVFEEFSRQDYKNFYDEFLNMDCAESEKELRWLQSKGAINIYDINTRNFAIKDATLYEKYSKFWSNFMTMLAKKEYALKKQNEAYENSTIPSHS